MEEREHIALWNSIVGKDDLVFYVGDFCDGTGHDLQEMGLRGREVGKTLLGIRLARMDGYITSREGEVGYAQSRLLAQREERRS